MKYLFILLILFAGSVSAYEMTDDMDKMEKYSQYAAFDFRFDWGGGVTSGGSGPTGDGIQLETGDFLLAETGNYLILE
jgi:hypothetical protein